MKKILTVVLLLSLCTTISYAQKLASKSDSNGIFKLQTTPLSLGTKEDINFSLIKYLDGQTSEYCLCLTVKENAPVMFPQRGKMLIKLQDETTMELTSAHSFIDTLPNGSLVSTAYFTLSNDEYAKCSTGVSKIRLQLFSQKKDGSLANDFEDKEYKKDVISAGIKKMEGVIAKEEAKVIEQIKALNNTNINSNF